MGDFWAFYLARFHLKLLIEDFGYEEIGRTNFEPRRERVCVDRLHGMRSRAVWHGRSGDRSRPDVYHQERSSKLRGFGGVVRGATIGRHDEWPHQRGQHG